MSADKQQKRKEFRIQIDREHYTVAQGFMTGAELRLLVTPPIPAERDLWLEGGGRPDVPDQPDQPDDKDRKIKDDEKVEIRNGMRFFTAPGHINPGRL